MFVLASESPRRQALLQQIGCDFIVHASHAEEVTDEMLLPKDLVVQNAQAKALAVAGEMGEYSILGADTVVALDGHVYGKPADGEAAKQMLSKLSGRTHQVLTGIAFVAEGRVYSDVAVTEVCFAKLTQEEIEDYVATGEPMDKAGAYALQGRAAVFIEGIRGSYSNVVGLPLRAVCQLAERAKVDLYGDYGKGSAAR